MDFGEIKYFGEVGFLYPHDIRFNPDDRAFCNPWPDGRVEFRLQTEPCFARVILVYNDGSVHGAPMQLSHSDSRFQYWETEIQPANSALKYSFALETDRETIIYFCKHGIDHAVEPLDRWELNLAPASDLQDSSPPLWMQGVVVYQIFPERFANGDPNNDPAGTVPWGSPPKWLEFQGGDLQGITKKLDYLQDLGIDVLYLNPINQSPSTHKYDAVDFFHVDPCLGGDDALHELIHALHQRGMRIILDASFNHCHPSFFAFQDLLVNGPDSDYCDWFTIYEFPIHICYRPHLIKGPYKQFLANLSKTTGIPLQAVSGAGPATEPSYLAWYGVLNMPKLNQQNPATRAYFMQVAAHWLREFEIDGWRMDVARHIESDFWQDFRRVCKATRPDCFLLSEIWGNTSPWLQGDQFDATMNYFFRDLCVSYFAQAKMDTRTLIDGTSRMLALYAPQVTSVTHNILSSHDTERFLTTASNNLGRLRLATLFQLTMPGAPGIYYGDEIGLSGGSDPDCRRAFPWNEQKTWDHSTHQMIKDLIRLRKMHSALRFGTWRPVLVKEESFAFERSTQQDRVIVLINREQKARQITLPIIASKPSILWGEGSVSSHGDALVVTGITPWSGVVIAPE